MRCLLLAVAAMTVLPWMMQQSMNTPQGVSREAYGWVVVGVQLLPAALLPAALFPLAAVLAGVGIILGWMRKHLRKAPQA